MSDRQELSVFRAEQHKAGCPVEVCLSMIEQSDGQVQICAVNRKDGSVVFGGHLITFIADTGRIYRHGAVSEALGFDLDEMGQIKTG